MTIKQAYDYSLIELNKVKAPTMLVEDFVYLFNKAIQQYINLAYSKAEYNQQASDDLSFLQTTDRLKFSGEPRREYQDTIWTVDLPKDYIHMLNCMATFTNSNDSKKVRCNNSSTKSTVTSLCRRLTADTYPMVLTNHYMKPNHKRPYWYIINTNDNSNKNGFYYDGNVLTVTNKDKDDTILNKNYSYEGVLVEKDQYSYIQLKPGGDRTSHQSPVKLEIHSGNDSKWVLDEVYITYLKSPMYVSMTEDDIWMEEDRTQNLEFPDYICYEIINLFVWLVMENQSDPRMQTNPIMNRTIPNPNTSS